MATQKQGQYIASLISKGTEYPTLMTIWDAQAKHRANEFDGRIIELGKKIEAGMSISQAMTVVKWFKGEKNQYGKDIPTSLVFDILIKANLL
jgi:hypothetical protein